MSGAKHLRTAPPPIYRRTHIVHTPSHTELHVAFELNFFFLMNKCYSNCCMNCLIWTISESVPFLFKMSFPCSPRSAVTVVGAKNVSLTPRSSSRSWRRSTRPASSSQKTREGASRPPPTYRSARSPSGSRTGGLRRKNSSANPKAITSTPLDKDRGFTSNLPKATCHLFTSRFRELDGQTFDLFVLVECVLIF